MVRQQKTGRSNGKKNNLERTVNVPVERAKLHELAVRLGHSVAPRAVHRASALGELADHVDLLNAECLSSIGDDMSKEPLYTSPKCPWHQPGPGSPG